jgi:hypothetical protein
MSTTANPNNPAPQPEEHVFEFDESTRAEYTKDSNGERVLITSRRDIKQFEAYKWWKQAIPSNELKGWRFANQMLKHISSKNGTYLRDEAGKYHILLNGRRIELDEESMALADVMMNVCHISTETPIGRIAIQRLQREAWKSSSKMTFRRFSAMYDGPEPKIYIPTATDGKILMIDSTGCTLVSNGENPDAVWLEHPADDPLQWAGKLSPDQARAALTRFEELLVNTQACVSEAMRWFVGMHEGLFPFIRDLIANRFIVVHNGPSGSGKTSGSQRFTILHGLGDVFGDVSIPALGNMPEQGLIVLDNKEQQNFSQSLIDYCLFLATGAARIRSTQDGAIRRAAPRPVGVITSIEGVVRQELHERCVNIDYAVRGEFLGRGEIESAIRRERHSILAAIAVVLQEYLTVRVGPEVHIGVSPIPRFEEHFTELARLLVAFGRVMGRGDGWGMGIISEWGVVLQPRGEAEATSPLEAPILQVIGQLKGVAKREGWVHGNLTGTLWVTDAGTLLSALQQLGIPNLTLPAEPKGFGKRLRSDRFQRFTVLDDESGVEELRRTKDGRRIGVFAPSGPENGG